MTATLDPRTRLLLEAPIAPTLLRLGAPNVLVMLAQAGVGLIETYFVGKLGTDALTGMEANLRFNGRENMMTRVFSRRSAGPRPWLGGTPRRRTAARCACCA